MIPQLFIKILLQFGDSSSREGARLTATGLGLLVVTLIAPHPAAAASAV